MIRRDSGQSKQRVVLLIREHYICSAVLCIPLMIHHHLGHMVRPFVGTARCWGERLRYRSAVDDLADENGA